MESPLVYADFQNLDDKNRLVLSSAGTLDDLSKHKIKLRDGLVLTFYMDDADEQNRPDDLLIDGTIQFDKERSRWTAVVDWSAIRHVSGEPALNTQQRT